MKLTKSKRALFLVMGLVLFAFLIVPLKSQKADLVKGRRLKEVQLRLAERTLSIREEKQLREISDSLSNLSCHLGLNSLEGQPVFNIQIIFEDGGSDTFAVTSTEWDTQCRTPEAIVNLLNELKR